jgi:dTDP-4-amino-4,6-dideoxygalactose transaminase
MLAKRDLPFGKPILGDEERNAVMEVLRGTQYVHGPKAKEFEAAFCAHMGGGSATSVASCTAALHLCYFSLGLGPGDEVVVPAQTHAATAHAVEFTGATPVFVDADPTTGNIDLAAVEAAIGPRTRAIGVVHYLGLSVAMDRLNAIAAKHGLFVVEDCALAIGTSYKGKPAGLWGDAGCFSFYPVKHMTTAEGGMLTSRHQEVVRKIERQKAFGVDRTVGERTIPGIYDVTMLGFNYRMNEIEAAIGIEQLKRVPGFLAQRRRNDAVLRARLAELSEIELLSAGDADHVHSNYCLAAILDDRIAPRRYEIIAHLRNSGVGTSVYYPVAVPHLSYYKAKYGTRDGAFPVASRISNQSIALSVGPHLSEDDMLYVADALKRAIRETAS